MNKNAPLTLSPDDPRVIAARDAEQRLFEFYGLKGKTHYVPLPGLGISVRVTEIGSGKPVLVVPGNTGDSFPLAPLLAQLKGVRLIVLNRPGSGLSEGINYHTVNFRGFTTQTIVTVLDAFAIGSAPVIAHSIGGHMSLWAAMDKPERITALTLLGVPGNIINTGPPFALRLLAVPIINRLLFNLIIPKSPQNSLRGLSFIGHPPETIGALPPAMADCYYYFQQLPHYKTASLSMMEQGSLFGTKPGFVITAEQLKTIHQPVQFLWGTNDTFGSVETGLVISKILPSAEFHSIQNGGHLPWLDAPEACGRLIMDFLSGLKPD